MYSTSKIAFITSTIFLGTTIVIGTNFALYKIVQSSNSNNKGLPNYTSPVSKDLDENIESDLNAINFFKKRTVSLTLVHNNELLFGTSWLLKQGAFQNEFLFVTNMHVISNFIITDNNDFIFDKSKIDSINIRFFNEKDNKYDSNPILFRTSTDDWDIDETVLKNNIGISRPIIDDLDVPSKINNGYIDFAVLKYKHNINSDINGEINNLFFNEWLAKASAEKLEFISQNEVNEMNSLNKTHEFYVSGFPVTKFKPTWSQKKYKWLPDNPNQAIYSPKVTTLAEMVDVTAWLNNDISIDIKDKNSKNVKYRSISRQLVLPGINLGGGSSGSMVTRKHPTIPNSFQIVGIWWGVYSLNRGGIDLVVSDNFNPINSKELWKDIVWKGYDNTK